MSENELTAMNLRELRQLASEHHVTNRSRLAKQDLIQALTNVVKDKVTKEKVVSEKVVTAKAAAPAKKKAAAKKTASKKSAAKKSAAKKEAAARPEPEVLDAAAVAGMTAVPVVAPTPVAPTTEITETPDAAPVAAKRPRRSRRSAQSERTDTAVAPTATVTAAAPATETTPETHAETSAESTAEAAPSRGRGRRRGGRNRRGSSDTETTDAAATEKASPADSKTPRVRGFAGVERAAQEEATAARTATTSSPERTPTARTSSARKPAETAAAKNTSRHAQRTERSQNKQVSTPSQTPVQRVPKPRLSSNQRNTPPILKRLKDLACGILELCDPDTPSWAQARLSELLAESGVYPTPCDGQPHPDFHTVLGNVTNDRVENGHIALIESPGFSLRGDRGDLFALRKAQVRIAGDSTVDTPETAPVATTPTPTATPAAPVKTAAVDASTAETPAVVVPTRARRNNVATVITPASTSTTADTSTTPVTTPEATASVAEKTSADAPAPVATNTDEAPTEARSQGRSRRSRNSRVTNDAPAQAVQEPADKVPAVVVEKKEAQTDVETETAVLEEVQKEVQKEAKKAPEKKAPRKPARASKAQALPLTAQSADELAERGASAGFAPLGLHPQILADLHSMGFEKPSPVQEQCIPLALADADIIGQAQTGTGKTAAFVLPILHKLYQWEGTHPVALICCPTRELAKQVHAEFTRMAGKSAARSALIYGGVSIDDQVRTLNLNPHVIIGTPGRLIDHIKRQTLDISQLKMMVLDEADQMLDIGFLPDIEFLFNHSPPKRQCMLFSATMAPAIKRLCETYQNDAKHVHIAPETATASSVDQKYIAVDRPKKNALLAHFIETHKPEQLMVFCKTKAQTDRVAQVLTRKNFKAAAIHGDLPQSKRERTLQDFRDGTLNCLIATNVAARGLDIPAISHVVNYDIPENSDEYVHRIGRTGRMGASGIARTFITAEDGQFLVEIEKLIGFELEEECIEGFTATTEKKITRTIADTPTNAPRILKPIVGGIRLGRRRRR